MKLLKKIKKGFTLVELVVVIAIIAILSGVSVAVYAGITTKAKETAARSEADSIGTVVRAGVLMEADGITVENQEVGTKNAASGAYEVATGKTVSVRAYWSDNTIKVSYKVETTEGDTNVYYINEAKVIAAIYEKVEKTTLAGTLTGDADPFDSKLDSFSYSPNKDDYKGTYTFRTSAAA